MYKKLVISSFLLIFIFGFFLSCQRNSSDTQGVKDGKPYPYPLSDAAVEIIPTVKITKPPYPIEEQPEYSETEVPDVVVPTPGKDTGVVTGQVVYTGTDDPVVNQYIYLGFKIFLTPGPDYTYGITQHGSPRTTTDNNGRFAIGDVPPGNYIILLWSLSGASVAKEPGATQELEITVKPGESIDLGKIEVNPIGAQ